MGHLEQDIYCLKTTNYMIGGNLTIKAGNSKMNCRVRVIMDNKVLLLQMDISELKKMHINDAFLDSLDKICEISITKDLVIITTEDPDFRNGAKCVPIMKENRRENNITAYDWQGNRVWNIADIVGDIKMSFFGGSVCTIETLKNTVGFDERLVPEGHDLFTCVAEGFLFVVDLTDAKVLQTLHAK